MDDVKKGLLVEKRTKLRFTIKDDVNLLKETLECNPYADTKRWREVYMNFMKVAPKKFSFRAVKEHVEYLLNSHLKQDRIIPRKLYIKKDYDEKDKLLDDLIILRREFKTKNIPSKKKEDVSIGLETDKTNAICMPIDILELKIDRPDFSDDPNDISSNIVESDSEGMVIDDEVASGSVTDTSRNALSPVCVLCKKQSFSASLTELLKERKVKDNDLERRKLDIEQQKIDLEKRRISLEEIKVNQIVKIQEQHHKLMEMLLQKFLSDK